MSDSLATLITKVQAAFGDVAGTYFTSALVTAGLRAALAEVNERAPIHAADIVEVVAEQHVYEVTDIADDALAVLGVFDYDEDGDEDIPLVFDQYWEDARLWLRLRTAEDDGYLLVGYSTPHIVSGLDGAAESTLPSMHDQTLVFGAAYHTLIIRSIARVETINLQQSVAENYQEAAVVFRQRFDVGLDKLSRQGAPVAEPDFSAWNDKYHNWPQ